MQERYTTTVRTKPVTTAYPQARRESIITPAFEKATRVIMYMAIAALFAVLVYKGIKLYQSHAALDALKVKVSSNFNEVENLKVSLKNSTDRQSAIAYAKQYLGMVLYK